MHNSHNSPPLTLSQRFDEIGRILATGIIRCQENDANASKTDLKDDSLPSDTCVQETG